MNKFVVDKMFVEKAGSERPDLIADVLIKFFQSDTAFRLCLDNGRVILNDYETIGLKYENLVCWFSLLSNNTDRISKVNVTKIKDIYLSTALAANPSHQLITCNKDYYLNNYKRDTRKIQLMDEYEAKKRLSQNITNNYQSIIGDHSSATFNSK